jgi:hypothetical protein
MNRIPPGQAVPAVSRGRAKPDGPAKAGDGFPEFPSFPIHQQPKIGRTATNIMPETGQIVKARSGSIHELAAARKQTAANDARQCGRLCIALYEPQRREGAKGSRNHERSFSTCLYVATLP